MSGGQRHPKRSALRKNNSRILAVATSVRGMEFFNRLIIRKRTPCDKVRTE
ncbi:hypothetical protein HETIRDRAFT_170470 [Heterobasidion irregulare TC 32-1]|uniref:Uncharacterized protein n=1 Tax=Heterobasidion irregulare (strain TC 32-1) TaxID=747525 RepID=W4KE19_HETIT|nr:uncharacterized protein HETIRDRAFT_170470 [Heterobasidion irregulare TC 32-1]ETW83999.1 hypothetical protein HETIRDRAFT_170470 [Heterobasidion irregulare TC 32-1]